MSCIPLNNLVILRLLETLFCSNRGETAIQTEQSRKKQKPHWIPKPLNHASLFLKTKNQMSLSTKREKNGTLKIAKSAKPKIPMPPSFKGQHQGM